METKQKTQAETFQDKGYYSHFKAAPIDAAIREAMAELSALFPEKKS